MLGRCALHPQRGVQGLPLMQCPPTALRHRNRSSRAGTVRCAAALDIIARWCIDIQYGQKLEALALLQEWTCDIGSQAGVTPFNSRISSGAIGVPESRLELEVSFDSVAALEQFWAAIPPEAHRAWSQRAQRFIVDGSPTWHIYRSCPLLPPQQDGVAAAQSIQPPVTTAAPPVVSPSQSQARFRFTQPDAKTQIELASDEVQIVEGADAETVLDWKGDPMTINPGDKLPFTFQ